MSKPATITIHVDADGAVRGFRTVRGEVVKTSNVAHNESKRFSSAVQTAYGFVLAQASAQGVQAVRRLIGELFELGTAGEETESKFRTVFGPSVAEVSSFVDEFATKAGFTRGELQELTASTGALVQGMGFTQEASAGLSEEVVRLAADLASFNNIQGGAEDVGRRIIQALTGETEAIKAVNVVLRQEEVIRRAKLQTGKEETDQLTKQERALATLAVITEQAGVAVGDLERTQDSIANTARRVSAELRSQQEIVAQGLLPTFGLMLDVLDGVIDGSGEAADAFVRFVAEGVFEAVVGLIEMGQEIGRTADLFLMLGESAGISKGELLEVLNPITQIQEELEWLNSFIEGSIRLWKMFWRGSHDAMGIALSTAGLKELGQSHFDAAEAISAEVTAMDMLAEARRQEREAMRGDIERRRGELQDFLNNLGTLREEAEERRRELLERMSGGANSDALKALADFERERTGLQIELMEDGLEKELALVDAQYAQRRAAVEKNFGAQYSAPLLALLDELQEKQKQKVEELFAAPEVPAFKVEVPVEIDLEDPQKELQRFVDEMQPLLVGSISELERQLSVLEDAFATAFTAEQRENIAAHIDTIRGLLEQMEGARYRAEDFNEAIRAALESSLEALSESVATAIGESLTAGDAMQNVSVAVIETAAGIAQQFGRILIATAVGIEAFKKSLKTLNPVAALVAGGALLALAGVARAAVRGLVDDNNDKGQQQTVPAFADGVTNFRGGTALVGERGPELVTLPRGSNVITNENTQRLLNSIGTAAQAGTLSPGSPQIIVQGITREELRTELEASDERRRKHIEGMPNPVVEVVEVSRAQDRLNRKRNRVGVIS